MSMGERDFVARYKDMRRYADEQAAAFAAGEEIVNWTYETDYKLGMPEPRKLRLTGAAWVAHAYDIAASDAETLVQVKGAWWQDAVDECKRLASQFRLEVTP